MKVNFGISTFSTIKNNKNVLNKSHSPQMTDEPSFKGTEGLTPEQIAAMAAQKINKNKPLPHITEKDINFEVTCAGHSQIKGNTRKVHDYRCSMQTSYGYNWYNNFHNPHIVRNGNLDEKWNGETTAIVFPLNPKTPQIRGGDHMAMVLSGYIEEPVLDELVNYMTEIGILNKEQIYNQKYYVNSLHPKQFMENPQIKTAIAQFFRQKEANNANATANTQVIDKEKDTSKIKISDINIVNIDQKTDKNNTHEVKDYLRYYLKNGKKFTVIHDKFSQNGVEKDMTAILIPSTKSDWDFITLTIDKKIPEEVCKNLLNHLVKSHMANVENENFRNEIVKYFENL